MSDWQTPAYSIDLALVIDATSSMSNLIETVKSRAMSLHEDLAAHIERADKNIDSLRVRVIAFRDFYADSAADSLVVSDFFTLPDERAGFTEFVRGIRAAGGGDVPETGLEALATAIRSPWATTGPEQRQVIVLWTDAAAHPLEKNRGLKPKEYPASLPADMDELTDLWDGPPHHVHPGGKRLLLIAPASYPWTYLADSWDATTHYPSRAGQGLRDTDFESVLAAIAAAAQDSVRPARKNRPAAPASAAPASAEPASAEPASAAPRGARWPWRRSRREAPLPL